MRTFFRSVCAAVISAPALVGCTSEADDGTLGRLALSSCPDIRTELASTVSCATLEVPQVHAEPQGAKLNLRLFVSKGSTPGREPVVYLTGGPGQSAGSLGYGGMTRYFAATLDRDVILVEQRGNALSSPALDCPFAQASSLEQGLRDCTSIYRARGIRLEAFNTIESAHDLEDLRLAIGVPKLLVWGASYGALLAGAFAREHPESVAALVLESSVLGDRPYRNFEQVLGSAAKSASFAEWLTVRCRSSYRCSTEYPYFDMSAEIERTRERLAEGGSVTLAPGLVVDSNTRLDDWLYSATYSVPIAMLFGRLLYASNRDLVTSFANIRVGEESAVDFLVSYLTEPWGSSSTNAVVNCYDVVNSWTEAGLADIASRYPEEERANVLAYASSYKSACSALPPPTVDPSRFSAPVSSAVPTLFVAGQLDPITPVEWARDDARAFPRSQVIESSCSSHGVLFQALECGASILSDFFDDTRAFSSDIDASCLEHECRQSTDADLFIETPRN